MGLTANASECKSVNEPFGEGRATSRLLFDFSLMLSCFKVGVADNTVLDFAAGTCWISEFLNRAGYDVTALDINSDSGKLAEIRLGCDQRLDAKNIHFRVADGHAMPFKEAAFSHICCFDSLHHMHDYPRVFGEFYRVLKAGGRIIFVEPGAKHSTSKETIEFIEKYKKDDPSWIERDVVLEDIWQIAETAGFRTMTVCPHLLPGLREYSVDQWLEFRRGSRHLEIDYLNWLKDFNYNSRVVFYSDK